MCVAPIAMMRAGGTTAWMNVSPSGPETRLLLAVQKRLAMSSGRFLSVREKTCRVPSESFVLTTMPLRPCRASIAFSMRARPPLSRSRRSTNTITRPPQGRPTLHAVSSATPNSSVLTLPCSRISSASVSTSPSMQPPETEPSNSPVTEIAIWPPTGTGAEPHVSTTVAIATLPSRAIQSPGGGHDVVRAGGADGVGLVWRMIWHVAAPSGVGRFAFSDAPGLSAG